MKRFAFAAMLMIGSAAVAQTTGSTTGTMGGDTTMSADQSTGTPDQAAPPTDTTTANPGSPDTTGSMTDDTMNNGTSTNGQTSNGSMTNGSMSTGSMNNGAMASNAPSATPGSYPRCSRTVTDGCVQGSGRERDTARSSRRPRRR